MFFRILGTIMVDAMPSYSNNKLVKINYILAFLLKNEYEHTYASNITKFGVVRVTCLKFNIQIGN
jgi:hypothetical protein